MYCQKCGKEIIQGSLFCTWCGATVPQEVISAHEQAAASAAEASCVCEPVAPIEPVAASEAVSTAGAAVSETGVAPEAQAAAVHEAVTYSEPTPAPAYSNAVAFGGEIIPTNDDTLMQKKADEPKKYYTGVHLFICLAAAGIMAAAAGVFAGLYFSMI